MPVPETSNNVDTARMWEIARYVEAHPEDSAQRWRLAKKLYAAWEYRLALEHLQILKQERLHKVNVIRYLAATYYRLGRYDESIHELQEATREWPGEVGLREQLARVLEIAGQREEAAAIWQQIRSQAPDHPLADSAVRRLTEAERNSPQEALHIGESDSGINLSPGYICPNCGAQNSDEFDRCWQCHTPFFTGASSARSTPRPERRGEHVLGMSLPTARLVGSLSALGLLTVCVYASIKLLLLWHGAAGAAAAADLASLYDRQLGLSRVVTGVVAVMFWPVILSMAVRMAGPEKPVSGSMLFLSGLNIGAVAFLCSWLPFDLLYLAILLPLALTLAALLAVLRLHPKRGFVAWMLHTGLMAAALLVTFTLTEFLQVGAIFNPLTDIRLLASAAPGPSNAPDPHPAWQNATVPLQLEGIVWESTGSPWLDKRAGEVKFVVNAAAEAPDLQFDLLENGITKNYLGIETKHFETDYRVIPGETYSLHLTPKIGSEAQAGAMVSLRIQGLLPWKVAHTVSADPPAAPSAVLEAEQQQQ